MIGMTVAVAGLMVVAKNVAPAMTAGANGFIAFGAAVLIRKEKGEYMKAFLILEDGHVFTGTSIGSTRDMISEIVFNTSMTGYLEVLTDPSYAGQAVVMTYPLIGNYGITPDMESRKAWPDGYIRKRIIHECQVISDARYNSGFP